MVSELLRIFRRGDRIYIDPSAQDAPLKLRGETGSIERVGTHDVVIARTGHPGEFISVPLDSVRPDRRHRRRSP